jgi:hypothetical protein
VNVTDIRTGLKTRLATIAALRETYRTVPDSIGDVPAAFVGGPETGEYDIDTNGNTRATYPVIVLVSRSPGDVNAQDTLDAFMASTGASSITAAIAAGSTLGGAADWAVVKGWEGYGGAWDFAGVTYLGVRFNIEVMA